jgi:hypothetical protein
MLSGRKSDAGHALNLCQIMESDGSKENDTDRYIRNFL